MSYQSTRTPKAPKPSMPDTPKGEARAKTPASDPGPRPGLQLETAERLGHDFARLPPVQRASRHPDPPKAGGGGSPLPSLVRTKMERALGSDLSRVRIHQGEEAESVGALAYTRGTDLHFQRGAYDPTSGPGQRLLGHELAHVVQQAQGRVASPVGAGAPINDDPKLEAEAEAAGARAAAGGVHDSLASSAPASSAPAAAGAPAAAPAPPAGASAPS